MIGQVVIHPRLGALHKVRNQVAGTGLIVHGWLSLEWCLMRPLREISPPHIPLALSDHLKRRRARPDVALLSAMDSTQQTGLDDLPAELVEKIAYQLPLATLKAFRLAEHRSAAAGFRPLLDFVPNAIKSSTLELRGRPNRELSQLAGLTSMPPIARILTSLIVGCGATRLDLLPKIHLPSLTHFELKTTRDHRCAGCHSLPYPPRPDPPVPRAG